MAVMAIGGGFLTPFLVGGTTDAQTTLFSYVILLVLGTLYLAGRRAWPMAERLQLRAHHRDRGGMGGCVLRPLEVPPHRAFLDGLLRALPARSGPGPSAGYGRRTARGTRARQRARPLPRGVSRHPRAPRSRVPRLPHRVYRGRGRLGGPASGPGGAGAALGGGDAAPARVDRRPPVTAVDRPVARDARGRVRAAPPGADGPPHANGGRPRTQRPAADASERPRSVPRGLRAARPAGRRLGANDRARACRPARGARLVAPPAAPARRPARPGGGVRAARGNGGREVRRRLAHRSVGRRRGSRDVDRPAGGARLVPRRRRDAAGGRGRALARAVGPAARARRISGCS